MLVDFSSFKQLFAPVLRSEAVSQILTAPLRHYGSVGMCLGGAQKTKPIRIQDLVVAGADFLIIYMALYWRNSFSGSILESLIGGGTLTAGTASASRDVEVKQVHWFSGQVSHMSVWLLIANMLNTDMVIEED